MKSEGEDGGKIETYYEKEPHKGIEIKEEEEKDEEVRRDIFLNWRGGGNRGKEREKERAREE